MRRVSMENMIKIFENEEFGQVRTVMKDGEPWFVGKDVANILEYRNGSRDINRHVDDEDRLKIMVFDGSQNKETIIINESGLYSLILSSKMSKAKEFKRWITSKVIPDIRKTGGYVGNADMFVDNYLSFADESIKILFKLQFQYIGQLQERIEHDQPLVEFAEQVANTDNLIDMNEMAKLARDENIPIGRNRLFGWLRSKNILMGNNLPYQRYIERGYFAVKESVFETGTMSKTYQQTCVTGKSQRFVIALLKKYYDKGENTCSDLS